MSTLDTTVKQRFAFTNFEQEKRKFLFDPLYNPQFEYEEDIDPEYLVKHGEVTGEYLERAQWIMNTVIKKFGSEDEYMNQTSGALLSRERTEKMIQSYLIEADVEAKVRVVFSPQFLPRTSVRREGNIHVLQVKLPIEYQENLLKSTLNHEVGTHVFRWLNDEQQPWYQEHRKYGLERYTFTEEGLASLQFQTANPIPYLWMAALYYFATYHAQTLSFAQLYNLLKKYVDQPERCWKICVRVKRGFTDTSLPGAYTKDQTYFAGAIQVAEWLTENDFAAEKLYIGKVALEDIEKCWNVSPNYVPLLPHFMKDTHYKQKLQDVISHNKLLG